MMHKNKKELCRAGVQMVHALHKEASPQQYCEKQCYTTKSLLAHRSISKCTFEHLLGKKLLTFFSHDQLSNTGICPKRESAVKTNFENKLRCHH